MSADTPLIPESHWRLMSTDTPLPTLLLTHTEIKRLARADAVEAERDRYRKALDDIATGRMSNDYSIEIARAALTPKEE